jgi:hypothetical protein
MRKSVAWLVEHKLKDQKVPTQECARMQMTSEILLNVTKKNSKAA